MKKIYSSLLFLIYSFFCFASPPLKIGVITDMHYLSEKLMDGGSAIRTLSKTSARDYIDEPAILDQVIAAYLKSNIKVLLVAGDITKDGELQSHIDFLKRLKPLMDRGVRVYVVPGNHDIDVPTAAGYKGGESHPVYTVSPTQFVQLYANCGYKRAISRDAASLSYVAELDANTWLIAIDGCLYKEYKTTTISAGRISPQTEKWICGVLDEAKRKHKRVIGLMHHGLVEHIMYQAEFFPDYLIKDHERLATLFADKGMKAIFTGHFHANDITAFSTKRGNEIYDIETGALISYPFAYRFVTLTYKGMDIRTRNVTSVPHNVRLVTESKADISKIVANMTRQKLERFHFISQSASDALVKLVTHIFLLHLKGDEKVDQELVNDMKAFDGDAKVDLSKIKLDYPPADNNVDILFSK